eukprot:GGOE01018073.1.p1 GENE.GGOE01018073.1~~GGOE01018073.1.p1  ORF type:complete len:284 (+),score=110.15 GGOE01018073.1:85-936(+)
MSVDQADELLKKAEKKMSQKLNFFGNKAEDAQDLFQQAATYYKANQKWEEAGNAYLRAKDCATKLKNPVDCASYYQDAALMFKKVNVWKAAECMQKALDLWDQHGRSGKSAKLANELAELFEKAEDAENAIEWYGRAADYYRIEGSGTTASQCRVQAAQLRAGRGEHDEAIRTLEEVAEQYLDDPLLKSSSTRYYFFAMLCRMARGDTADELQQAFVSYCDKDLMFAEEMREHVLVRQLIAAKADRDLGAFEEAIQNFNAVLRMDDVKMKLLKAAAANLEDMR